MDKKDTADRNEIIAICIMGGFFVLINTLSLFIIGLYQPAFENTSDPLNIAIILAIMLAFTGIILLIVKFFKKQLIQIIMLAAIGYTAGYILWPLYGLFIPSLFAGLVALFSAIIIVVLLYKYPEWYVIDLCGIIVGAGAIAIFGKSLDIYLVLIFLVILAIYDAISVYKTKHMIDLADTVMDLKLPVLLVVPKIKNYSIIKETKSLKEKIDSGEERDAFFMGLGDIVMPGILLAAVFNYFKEADQIINGLPVVFSILFGTIVGFGVLMMYVMKGKPQAGLPCLCGGAILGYLVSSYIFFGGLVGLGLPF